VGGSYHASAVHIRLWQENRHCSGQDARLFGHELSYLADLPVDLNIFPEKPFDSS
jgi:hypothetical protein